MKLHEFDGKKVQIITDSDMDGTSCRLIFEHFLYENEILRITQSSASEISSLLTDEIITENDVIVFADLTPNEIWYKKVLDSGKLVYIFDHHISAYEKLSKYENPNYNYTTAKCSAKILFDWFGIHNSAMEQYVYYVDIYDRYLDNNPDFDYARGINNLLFWYIRESRWKGKEGYNKFINVQSKKFQIWNKFKLHDYEQKEVDNEFEKEKASVKKAYKGLEQRIDTFGNLYGYFELSSKISYVCSIILKENPSFKYVICRNTFVNEYFKFSIRSKVEDVTKIAGVYKGGGHTHASGFSVVEERLGKAIINGKHVIGVCYFRGWINEEELTRRLFKSSLFLEYLKCLMESKQNAPLVP